MQSQHNLWYLKVSALISEPWHENHGWAILVEGSSKLVISRDSMVFFHKISLTSVIALHNLFRARKKNTQPRRTSLTGCKAGNTWRGDWGYILREFASDAQWTDKETRIARRHTHFGETNGRGKRFYDRNLSLPTQLQDWNQILIKDGNKLTIKTHWN